MKKLASSVLTVSVADYEMKVVDIYEVCFTPANGDKPTPLPPLPIVRGGLHPPRPNPNI